MTNTLPTDPNQQDQAQQFNIDVLHTTEPQEVEELQGVLSNLYGEVPLDPAWVEHIVKNGDQDIIVAREAQTGRIVGTLTVSAVYEPVQSGSFVQVGGVAITPESRGKGLVDKMYQATEKWALEHGITKARLFTEPTERPAADGAYKRIGFEYDDTNSHGDRRTHYVKRIEPGTSE